MDSKSPMAWIRREHSRPKLAIDISSTRCATNTLIGFPIRRFSWHTAMHPPKKLVLGILLLSILSTALAIPKASAAQNLWVWVKKERRYVTSEQSVAGSVPLSGIFVFSTGIQNMGPGSVQGATIAFTSARDGQSLIADVGGVGYPSTILRSDTYAGGVAHTELRYTWNMPEISPGSYEQVWFNTPAKCTFTAGFDSSREVTPTLVENETVMQQVRILVKPVQRFRALLVGMSLEGSDRVRVELVRGSDRPSLNEKSSTFVNWWIESPQVSKAYEFSLKLKLTNLIFPSRADFVPWMEVGAYESQRVNAWSTPEWHGTPEPDLDLSIHDVTVNVPGNHGSNVAIEVVKTVGFRQASTAQLKTTVTVGGLPADLLAGLHLVVDGKSVESTMEGTATLYLSERDHTIGVPSAIEDSPGVRYYCERDTILLARSDVSLYLKGKAHSLILGFNFLKQFHLQVYSWGDNNNHTDQWLPPGSIVTIRASTFVFPSNVPLGLFPFTVAYRFQGWQGTIESKSSSLSFALDQPTSMTALWVPDYLPIFTTSALILIFTLFMGALLVSRRRKAMPSERSGIDAETLLRRLETLKASGAIPESVYGKLRSEYEKRRGKD
jgi:hypothetical protein